jgi:hypothetical protein
MFSNEMILDFCFYLFKYVFNVNRIPDVSINSGTITVRYGNAEYSEAIFDPQHITITSEEIGKLLQITKDPDLFLRNATIENKTIPVLKLSSYFITEQYFYSKETDPHGRLNNTNVDKKTEPILSIPIVDVLAIWLAKRLSIDRVEKKIILSSDFDILDLWTHLNNLSSLRYLTSFIRKADFAGFARESFRYLENIFTKNSINPYLNDSMFYYDRSSLKIENIAFWLIHSSHPSYDIRNNFTDKRILNFIDSLHKKNVHFGLHPSYESMNKPDLLLTQQEEYLSIFGQKATSARFHFVRCKYPESLIHLQNAGISSDYTFYFQDTLNFRGGISSSFKYWDFTGNKPVDVLIHPITLMDGTLNDYLKLSKKNAIDACRTKIETSLKFGTEVTLLWHNRSIYKYGFPNNYQPEIYSILRKILLSSNFN